MLGTTNSMLMPGKTGRGGVAYTPGDLERVAPVTGYSRNFP